MVYALLPSKSADTYNYVIDKLMWLIRDNIDEHYQGPATWTTDYEIAMIRAIETNINLPNTVPCGCLFHFSQAVWRHIQQYGLASLYQHNERYRLKLNVLLALAFLPLEEVRDAFQDLIDEEFFFELNDELDESGGEEAGLRRVSRIVLCNS